jgi:hypothetical protein
MDAKTIEEEALHLPVAVRADLAQKLLLSLEGDSPAEIEAEWLHEAERRAREIDEGAVELVPAELVRQRARALLK